MAGNVVGWVMRHSKVENKTDLLVLVALAEHAHPDGDGAFPSATRLASFCRMSERGVRESLRRLREVGAIDHFDRWSPRGTRVYRVSMTDSAAGPDRAIPDPPAAHAPLQEVHPPASHTGEGCRPTYEAPAGAAPKPSVEPSAQPNPPTPKGEESRYRLLLEEWEVGDRLAPPPRPEGGRKRERDWFRAALGSWACELLPDLTPQQAHDRVAGAIGVLGRDRSTRFAVLVQVDRLYGSDEREAA